MGQAAHGERLDVLETRRRFVKVRTAAGVEGWVDSNVLLTEQQMGDLRRLADSTSKLPSQGKATVFDALNMHTEPNRQSPSFFQIPEGGSVEVIGHRVAPRVAIAPPKLAAKRTASTKKTKAATKQVDALPLPKPPAPPSNWQELSRAQAAAPANPPAHEVAAPVDDWSLVRMQADKAGWVLSRMLSMSIPDDVAQYAEGRRITAYVSLGEVKDQAETKQNWLWTTSSSGQSPYDFDSFRVFIWSVKRHHYETAYIERDVRGYYPVEAKAVPGEEEKVFSLVMEDKDGKLYRRTYGFSGYHIRMIAKTLYQKQDEDSGGQVSSAPSPLPAPPSGSWFSRVRDWAQKLRRK